MDSAVKVPISGRINLRMILFVGVVLLLVGYPVYWYVESEVTGGVRQAGGLHLRRSESAGNFPFDSTNGSAKDVPARFRSLDGQKVLLEGEVWVPNEAGDRMTRFELVYSIQKCCFGGPPRVQERVFVQVPKQMHVPNLTNNYVRVTGTLHIDPKNDGGQISELYTLSLDRIEPM